MDSLQATEAYSAARSVAPRVSLVDIQDSIAAKYHINAFEAVEAVGAPAHEALKMLTVCILVMKNGFVLIGKSAPASPENFDREKGERFSYEDAVRQLWPLMGFALRDKLAEAA
jgi:hypothetical protein